MSFEKGFFSSTLNNANKLVLKLHDKKEESKIKVHIYLCKSPRSQLCYFFVIIYLNFCQQSSPGNPNSMPTF